MELLYLLYMLLLCGFLPLYMNAGYFELGEAKALCYLVISIPIAIILLVKEAFGFKKSTRTIENFFLYGTLFSALFVTPWELR